MRHLVASLLLVVTAVHSISAADPPSPDDVRAAVARSLPFLEREGLAWMRENACMTCHQIPMMAWSANTARRHDLPIDDAKVDRWNEWAVNNALKRAVYYNLATEALEALAADGWSDEELKVLEPLKDRRFVFEQDFRDALADKLPAEFVAAHGEALLKCAAKPKQGGAGGGENNQYTALLLCGALGMSDAAAPTRSMVVEALVKRQNQDGSWPIASQFAAQRRPKDESIEVATRWALVALTDLPEGPASAEPAMSKARDWLAKPSPASTTETVMLRAMVAERRGEKQVSASLADELLALQHADGGWSWLKDGATSDPLTTGQVLYGLAYLGRDGSDPAIRRAWRYLVNTQAADGRWPQTRDVISTAKKKDSKPGDAVYTYWATGWAAVGLLETLP
ncbi:MAG TPA: prenyltransferase/squalene oxidase repeat-containing protein [Pirellulales bacterium]|nr:prenyltransferase/squalene oxidase repeat-containing protein [Pirellulales bacterium]